MKEIKKKLKYSYTTISLTMLIPVFSTLLFWGISSNVTVATVTLLLSMFLCSIINLQDYENRKIYIFIYLFQIIFLALVYYAEKNHYGIPYFNGGSDDLTYEQEAFRLYELGVRSIKDAKIMVLGEYHNSPGYPLLLSFIIYIMNLIGEYHTIIPRILNVVLYIGALMLLQDIVKKLINFDNKKFQLLIILMGFFPVIAYINVHVFRDTLLFFLIILYIWILLKFHTTNFKVIELFKIIITLYFICLLRSAMVPYLIIIGLFIYIRKKEISFIGFPILIILFLFLNPNFIQNIIGFYGNYYEVYNEIILDNNSSGFSSIIFSIPLFPFGIIIRIIYGIMTPFPDISACIRVFTEFNLFDFMQLLLALSTLFQIYLFSFIFSKKNIREKSFIVFIIFYLAYVVGTFTFRHLYIVYPFIFMLSINNFTERNKKSNFIRIFIITYIIIFLCSIYILMKF